MNSVDFCYWLQGHFELNPSNHLTLEQVEVIRNHLNLVFKHEIDPIRNSQTTATPKELQEVHDGKKPNTPWPPSSSGFSSELIRC